MTLEQWLLAGILVAELGQFGVGAWRLVFARRSHDHALRPQPPRLPAIR
jgi:hypothetical protein